MAKLLMTASRRPTRTTIASVLKMSFRYAACVCARMHARKHARSRAHTNVDRCSIQGLDLAVQNMKLGDRWLVKVPPALAFGDKGIKPSPGKPRIPGGATLDYEIFFEIYPGLEDDLMEE